MKDKKKLGLIGAVVLTLFGTIALVAFVQSAEDHALADQEVVNALIASVDIPAGTSVADLAAFTEVKQIPVGAKTPATYSSLAELPDGLVTTIDLVANEQITATRVAVAEEFARQGSIEIPEGAMEVTVRLGIEQTIGGTLTAGERVALTLTLEEETGVVLHKLLVTHVQGAPVPSAQESTAVASNERPPAPGGDLLVTFAVDVDQLQRIVWASEHGSVWLAREPDAAPELSTEPQKNARESMVDLQVQQPTPSPSADAEAGRVITVLSPKGGAGKTTLAVNIAAGLAKHAPGQVVIVDTDLQFGDVGTAMGLRPQTTFFDAVRVGLEDSVSLKLQLVGHSSGCWALCAPDHPAQADAITAEHVQTVVRNLRKTFKYVVVDNEPGLGERALGALDESTDILMICVTDVPSARGLRKAIQALDQVRIVEPRRHFVLNRADARVDLEEADIVRMVGLEVDVRIPSDRVFPIGMNRGVPVIVSEVEGKAVEALWTLVERFGGSSASDQLPAKTGKGFFRKRG